MKYKIKIYVRLALVLVLILVFFIFYPNLKKTITQKKEISTASEYFDKAIYLADQAKHDSAILYLGRASRIFLHNSVWDKYMDVENQIGWTFIKKGEITNARCHFEDIMISGNNLSNLPLNYNAYLLENTGITYVLTGNYKEAVQLFQSALTIYSSIPEESQKINRIKYLISKSENLAKYPQIDYRTYCPQNYFESRLNRIETEMRESKMSSRFLYYSSYNSQKRRIWDSFFRDEETSTRNLRYYFCELMDIREELVSMQPLYYLDIYDSLGAYCERKEQYDNALAIYRMTSELRENRLDMSYSLEKIGDIYFKQKDYENATKFYLEFCTSLIRNLTITHPLIRNYCDYYSLKFSSVNKPELANRFAGLIEVIKEEMSLMNRDMLERERIKYQGIEIPDWLVLK